LRGAAFSTKVDHQSKGENAMIKSVFVFVAFAYMATLAGATTLSFKINNQTGQVINSILATPKLGGADIAITPTPIAAAATTNVNASPAGNACVFTLTTTLASSKVITNPDTDLCQTDMFVVQ
jgi:hypothetical protein